MSKHTPGPWTRRVTKKGVSIVQMPTANRTPQEILTICDGFKVDSANARLIAAAPDMLAACKQLVEAVGNPTDLRLGSEQLQRFISAWGDMRRAVAKAEGTS